MPKRSRSGNDLATTIDNLIERRINSYKHTFIARIIKYYPERAKADIQPLLNKKNAFGVYEESSLLLECPVVQQKVGSFVFNVPYETNDTVVCVTNRDKLESLLVEGKPTESNYDNLRKHDITDTIVIGSITNYEEQAHGLTDSLNITNRSTGSKIELTKEGTINITATGGDLNVVSNGTANITSTGNTNITAPLTNVDGNLNVTGTITAPTVQATTSLTVANKEMSQHDHFGGTESDGSTGVPR